MELKAYWEIICRRKWILAVSVVVVPLFAFIIMAVSTPIYKSEAELWVKIRTLEQKFFKDISDYIGTFEFTTSDNAMGTIEELLKNSKSIERVINDLNLTDKKGDKFVPSKFTNPNKMMLILHLQEKGFREEQITDSDVIKVTGYSTSPSEANAIANRVLQELVHSYNDMYKDAAEKAEKVFCARLQDINKRLDDAAKALEKYRIENKVYSVSGQLSTLLTEISTLESQRLSAVSNLKSAQNDLNDIKDASMLRKNKIKDALVSIESNDVLTNYKNELLTLEAELAKLKVESTPEHPDVKIHQQQIELVKKKISNEIAKSFSAQITGRDSLYDTLSTKYADSMFSIIESTVIIKNIDNQLDVKRNTLDRIPEMDRLYNELQWNIDILKSKRDSMYSDYETVKSAKLLELSNPFVFQPPTLFKETKNNLFFPPKSKKVAMVVAFCLGVFLGLFLIFFMEYLNVNARQLASKQKFSGDEHAESFK